MNKHAILHKSKGHGSFVFGFQKFLSILVYLSTFWRQLCLGGHPQLGHRTKPSAIEASTSDAKRWHVQAVRIRYVRNDVASFSHGEFSNVQHLLQISGWLCTSVHKSCISAHKRHFLSRIAALAES